MLSPPRNSRTNRTPVVDWRSTLSGGDSRPVLDLRRYQDHDPTIERTWDVDSILSKASCLSVNKGLYISYKSPVMRNRRKSVHLFYQKRALHLIPHLRLGSGRLSPQFSMLIFFPNASHRTTSYLTAEGRQLWVDQLVLPAVRRSCPPDILQYHPRSFSDMQSKALSRQREACGGRLVAASICTIISLRNIEHRYGGI